MLQESLSLVSPELLRFQFKKKILGYSDPPGPRILKTQVIFAKSEISRSPTLLSRISHVHVTRWMRMSPTLLVHLNPFVGILAAPEVTVCSEIVQSSGQVIHLLN
jgi:hypothetical protein